MIRVVGDAETEEVVLVSESLRDPAPEADAGGVLGSAIELSQVLAGRNRVDLPSATIATFSETGGYLSSEISLPPETELATGYPWGSRGARDALVRIWTNAIVSPYANGLACAGDQTTIIAASSPLYCVDVFGFSTENAAQVEPSTAPGQHVDPITWIQSRAHVSMLSRIFSKD